MYTRNTLVAAILCLLISCALQAQKPDKHGVIPDSSFKGWTYDLDHIVGLVYLPHPAHRYYYKLTHVDSKTTLVREFNPADVCIQQVLMVAIKDGQHTEITSNEWGEVTEEKGFVRAGANAFWVTVTSTGRNIDWPCTKRKYIFRKGSLAEAWYVDANGNLCSNKKGFAREVYTRYDTGAKKGFVRAYAYFDAAGHPALSGETGCYKLLTDYDDHGNQVSRTYLDASGRPMKNKTGVYRTESTYDEDGNETRMENKDTLGRPMKSVYGIAAYVKEYKNGWQIKQLRCDERDQFVSPTEPGDSVAIIKYLRDDRGNELEKTFYNTKGEPVNNQRGIHLSRSLYSNDDKLTDLSLWSSDNRAVTDETGVHAYHYEYDKQGRLLSEAFFNILGRLSSDNFDNADIVRYQYNEEGQTIYKSYWENDTVPMTGPKGHHQLRYRYDEQGQLQTTDYLDQQGRHTLGKVGYSREDVRYNTRGQLAERSFFDAAKPILVQNDEYYIRNYHSICFTYDSLNRTSTIIYLDEKEQPVNAVVDLRQDNRMIYCYKIEFIYKGSTLAQERLYPTSQNAEPIVLDCFEQASVGLSGTGRRPPLNTRIEAPPRMESSPL